MRPLRTIASTLAVAILATSCGADGNQERDTAANTQGVTDDTIVIGTHQPLTGPASPGFRYVSTGARAVFDHINENGGVHGRRIDYQDRKSTRLNSSHVSISYAVFCLKKKTKHNQCDT